MGTAPVSWVVITPPQQRRSDQMMRYRVIHTPRAEVQWAVTPLE